ncbi:PEP-CTERM sorting domain-containing protein [Rubritalea tangerina]|uniref:PEP-CTERM sorting domain-containing protein n=1 Tax=Rubritalea tangerina TaxID=430798 RepID=A0ABW4Z8K5_9BACT
MNPHTSIAVLATAFATLASSHAATLLDHTTANGAAFGNYAGQSFSLNDSGFTLTGDPLGSTIALQDIVLFNQNGSGDTVGDIYLNVYQGSTFIGSSTNTIDWAAITTTGQSATYTFANLLLSSDTSTVYNYRFSTTNTDGGLNAVARIQVLQESGAGKLTSGTLLDTSGATIDQFFDAKLQVTIVPEPSTFALLGLGSLALLMRRRK